MFFNRLEQVVKTFLLTLFFLVTPYACNAFEVSPPVADVSFANSSNEIEQLFLLRIVKKG